MRRWRSSARLFSPRIRWLFAGTLALGPAVLLLTIAAINAPQIEVWFHTGMCPGGPMDRLPGPCGPLEIFSITVLGGWLAPVVLMAVMAWWAACIVVLLLTLAVRSRSVAAKHARRTERIS